jgi:bifunctional non-homologous end joining protein LigD
LHVVSPLASSKRCPLDWPTAKAFARDLCQRMADDSPDRYTMNIVDTLPSGLILAPWREEA